MFVMRFLFAHQTMQALHRKDGENFSTGQVGRMILEHPVVALAVAYGVPCPISDEWVMAAIKLRDGATFDPQAFYDWCEQQVSGGSMDRKWLPDFVRIVTAFEYTETQKVLVSHLKQVHFDRRKLPEGQLYWRQRGDHTFRAFTAADFEALRGEFAARERSQLIDR